jgi:transcriptional regulator with XRE-family HTH domain
MSETWPEYLRRITHGQTQTQIAQQIGIGRLSVNNWLHGRSRPKAETAIIVAQVYRRSPLEALLAAAYLEPGDLGGSGVVPTSLRDQPAHAITEEVRRRLTALEHLEATETMTRADDELRGSHQE